MVGTYGAPIIEEKINDAPYRDIKIRKIKRENTKIKYKISEIIHLV